jgi:ketosteroid isomerase-like protein
MSEENVEVVRRAWQAWRAGGIDAALKYFDAKIEWQVRPDLPDADIYRGHEGVQDLLARFDDVVEDMWWRPEGFIPAGDDRVVAPLRWGGRGKGSDIEFEESETWTYTVRGSKIVRVEEFATKEQALEAAGLSE